MSAPTPTLPQQEALRALSSAAAPPRRKYPTTARLRCHPGLWCPPSSLQELLTVRHIVYRDDTEQMIPVRGLGSGGDPMLGKGQEPVICNSARQTLGSSWTVPRVAHKSFLSHLQRKLLLGHIQIYSTSPNRLDFPQGAAAGDPPLRGFQLAGRRLEPLLSAELSGGGLYPAHDCHTTAPVVAWTRPATGTS